MHKSFPAIERRTYWLFGEKQDEILTFKRGGKSYIGSNVEEERREWT